MKLRVWPFDFNEFFMEAAHKSVVSNIDISFNGLNIMACTDTGNIGLLDVSTYNYDTLIRTNHNAVTDFDSVYNQQNDLLVAVLCNTEKVKVYQEDSSQGVN